MQGSGDSTEGLGIVDFDWDSRDLEIDDHGLSDHEDDDRIDRTYGELFGNAPSANMSATEKYDAIAERRFGPDPVSSGGLESYES